jgi:hypothetical protein
LNIVMNAVTAAEAVRDLLNRGAAGKFAQRDHQMQLLPPAPEGEARLLDHRPRQRPFADRDARRPLLERTAIGRIRTQRIRDPPNFRRSETGK